MSVLVYIESQGDSFKKKNFEAVNYAAKTAAAFGGQVTALVIGNHNESSVETLSQYGADNILIANDASLNTFNPANYSEVIVQAAQQSDTQFIVMAFDAEGKAIAPLLSAKLKAGLVAGAVDYPTQENGCTVKKTVFSGKAFAHVKINTDKKIISFVPNSHAVESIPKTATITTLSAQGTNTTIEKISENVIKGEVPLSEAELVVSGGRGLKGPENWGILEDLADALGASLACSRPVADSDWRPHHEHVGQTGGTIRPNLYVACGISGAIQHLAGVNNSKTIVVINKDPEAPFFKAADYGVVGDLFEVVPKLTEAVKKLKGN